MSEYHVIKIGSVNALLYFPILFLVIDGSVLKNDVKQRLAKERREEKKRQQEGLF